MLLVAHHQREGFYLPAEKALPWYGISGDSAARGLRELRDMDLLTCRQDWIKNQRSETGWVEQRLQQSGRTARSGSARAGR